eukprot:m.136725 g.136725  ORF g.136725 m.136725 type:complete len:948 (+) comp10869_c0_seq1:30-2873(+)
MDEMMEETRIDGVGDNLSSTSVLTSPSSIHRQNSSVSSSVQMKLNAAGIYDAHHLYKNCKKEMDHGRMARRDEKGNHYKVHCVLQYRLPLEEHLLDEILEVENKSYEEVTNVLSMATSSTSSEVRQAYRRKYFEEQLEANFLLKSMEQSISDMEKEADPEQKEKFQDDYNSTKDAHIHRSLILEKEYADGVHHIDVYVKIYCPLPVLLREAEKARLKLPVNSDKVGVRVGKRQSANFHRMSTVFKNISNSLATVAGSVAGPVAEASGTEFNLEFKVSNFNKHISSDDPENFFTQAQELYLLSRMLQRRRYGPVEASNSYNVRAGIHRLLHKKTYSKCFPLHDSDASSKGRIVGTRSQLNNEWVAWKNWYRTQPMNKIRGYFGERTSFYFLWLGFYTRWLIAPAIAGLVIFISGFSLQDSPDITELCSSNKTMCKICSSCEQWTLSNACDAYRYSYFIDNHLTVGFSFFMCVWATLFLEFWKRRQARAAWHWGVNSLSESEPQRPEFHGEEDIDEITGLLQKFYPSARRRRRYFITFLTVIVMLVIVILIVIGLVAFRVFIREVITEKSNASNQVNDLYTLAISSSILVIAIVSFNFLYNIIAIFLTDWENHERQSDYENSLASKVFMFQFVNNYASLFYVAFAKTSVTTRPDRMHEIFGYTPDSCSEYGCLIEITILLAVIMVGRQAFDNIKEVFVPEIWGFINKKRNKYVVRSGADLSESTPPWVKQSIMAAQGKLGLFGEYWELLIQFGFITLFINAFPLGPLFALINNIFERRVDSIKQVRLFRREFPFVASNIGVWQQLLLYISTIAVLTNGFVIAITSNYIPRFVYESNHNTLAGYIEERYSYFPPDNCYYRGFEEDGQKTALYWQIFTARFAFVIVFEHAVFLIKYIVAVIIGDIPGDVIKKMRTEDYIIQRIVDKSLENDVVANHQVETPITSWRNSSLL